MDTGCFAPVMYGEYSPEHNTWEWRYDENHVQYINHRHVVMAICGLLKGNDYTTASALYPMTREEAAFLLNNWEKIVSFPEDFDGDEQ